MAAFTFDGDGSGEPLTEGATASDNNGGSDPFGATSFGGDVGGSGDGFDPERHQGRDKRNADGSFRNKRQRRGSAGAGASTGRRNEKKTDYTASVDGLTNVLIMLHHGLANLTKVPQMELERETEAKPLAYALATVAEEFDIPIDSKTQAIVGLIIAGTSVYGPRFYFLNEKKKETKKRKTRPAAEIVTMDGTVFDFGDPQAS